MSKLNAIYNFIDFIDDHKYILDRGVHSFEKKIVVFDERF